MSPISKGLRVRMSKLGAERCPRIADKHGTVVGGGCYNTVIRVLFDDSKSPVSLHKDYLEKVVTGSEQRHSLGAGGIEGGAAREARGLKMPAGEQREQNRARDGGDGSQ
jgi:hypothetical protein